ncbi:MAG: cation efflux system protein [Phycisphaerales bacterium]|nr:MAG: cation efflux system protein [Phycisphaerales bacterium]
MAHQHDHHHHAPEAMGDGPLIWAVVVNVLLTVVEIVAGALSGSLALIADGLHNLGDAASLVVALVGRRIARKPADERNTFGYKRADIVGAQANLMLLVVTGGYLVLEGIQRLLMPQPVMGLVIMIVAAVALVVDLASAWLTAKMAGQSLGTRAAMVHKIADAASSVGAIVAGALVWTMGWHWIDPLIAFMIAGYMIWQALAMFGHTTGILMQAVPSDLDLREVAQDLATIDGVQDVHHVHIWSLDPHTVLLEAHVVTDRTTLEAIEPIKHALRQRCADRWNIRHTTLEFETVANALREAAQDRDKTRLVPDH